MNQHVNPERSVVLTRIFDAPRALVWKAWTDPKMMKEWFGPKVFTNSVCELDVRVGGKMLVVMRAPDGTEYPCAGEFRTIVEGERIEFTNNAVAKDGSLMLRGESVVTFADAPGGKTKMVLSTKAVGLVPEAPMMLAGMEEGWSGSFEKLAALLAKA
ncbi:MAG: SRPBCC domain-containing protein [Pseudolabrys sp.]|nr:SRPBCC domain-containing protein [Pseudolabrys sp.]